MSRKLAIEHWPRSAKCTGNLELSFAACFNHTILLTSNFNSGQSLKLLYTLILIEHFALTCAAKHCLASTTEF